MPIRKISQAEAAENKKKQQVLRTAGYNIKVDGSWGPWQEKQYRKVTSAKRGKTSQANVGVMALPVAGYGIAQLLEGLGSVSLPSISAPAAAMAAPVALTLAGPAYGLYETITGQHHQGNITPQERQAMTYASDATRVSRPIVVSRTRVGNQAQARPIGEKYINPVLARPRSVSMASEAVSDTATVTPAPRDTISHPSPAPQDSNKKPENEKKPEDKKKGSVQEIKESAKKNLDRIKRMHTRIGKMAVNTAINTLGVATGLTPLALGGYGIYKAFFEEDPTPAEQRLEKAKKERKEAEMNKQASELEMGTDSINNSTSRSTQTTKQQQYSPLDSIRIAAQRASLSYLDSLELNQ